MYHRLLLLLNIKPGESFVVRQLFIVQFFLGVSTAFLFTSSLTLFLSNYEIKMLPRVYILSSVLLILFNILYGRLDAKFSAKKLLQWVIVFSALSVFAYWIGLEFFPFYWLPFLLAAWYMLLYMLVGYAFWGMTAVLFNVRESKRVFSIVGAGDIPAKMLGYFSVTALVPFIRINNLLWVSIISLCIAYILLRRFNDPQGIITRNETHVPSGSRERHETNTTFINRIFSNRLIFYIAILSLLAYIVFAFIDFTFLSDIKLKYQSGEELATFIAIFFAAGRILAIVIKLLFSSRMIARMGLANALLVTPLLLLAMDCFIIYSGDRFITHLYFFGFMVMVTEILRSTLQEPVFFILFQPLQPHDRLKGHLIAKGHTLPFALLGVGIFLSIYLNTNQALPVLLLAKILVVFLVLWILVVFLIRSEYLQTLITTLKKGYFTGSELFLNDDSVSRILISKTESNNPLDVIHALDLLERSAYADSYTLLLKHLQNPSVDVRTYVLSRIVGNNMTSALPLIKKQFATTNEPNLQCRLNKALYFLEKDELPKLIDQLPQLDKNNKKAAFTGLFYRKSEEINTMVKSEMQELTNGSIEDKMLVLDIIMEVPEVDFNILLSSLLNDPIPAVYKKAIEATGKSRAFDLMGKALEMAIRHRAYHSLQKALIQSGDELFDIISWIPDPVPEIVQSIIIKATGKIKGDYSTGFLVSQLEQSSHKGDLIIEALWAKRAVISSFANNIVMQWIQKKLTHASLKMSYYKNLLSGKQVKLLSQALNNEINHDLYILLKGFSLTVDRPKIDRVLELLKLGDSAKIANAIEILELIIPNRFFPQLNALVELLRDINLNQVIGTGSQKSETLVPNTVENILDYKSDCNIWTSSVACYLMPRIAYTDNSLRALNTKRKNDNDNLFSETKNYVLSMLK